MPDAKRGSNFLNNVAGHVDWAFANGITAGMDYGAFGSDTACTRVQIVTFLYRARLVLPNAAEEQIIAPLKNHAAKPIP